MTNIFVGNLSYQTTQEELEAAFSQYGAVDRVSIVRDRGTGQPRGFAFVEMANSAEAAKAIAELNDHHVLLVKLCACYHAGRYGWWFPGTEALANDAAATLLD